MFAVIKTGGKQYKVLKDSIIRIEKIDAELGSKVEFNEILMIGGGVNDTIVGTPVVKNAAVTGQILCHKNASKIIVFKKKRRQNYRRKQGHKQELTHVKILDIKKV